VRDELISIAAKHNVELLATCPRAVFLETEEGKVVKVAKLLRREQEGIDVTTPRGVRKELMSKGAPFAVARQVERFLRKHNIKPLDVFVDAVEEPCGDGEYISRCFIVVPVRHGEELVEYDFRHSSGRFLCRRAFQTPKASEPLRKWKAVVDWEPKAA
jgi:hypothetical protein